MCVALPPCGHTCLSKKIFEKMKEKILYSLDPETLIMRHPVERQGTMRTLCSKSHHCCSTDRKIDTQKEFVKDESHPPKQKKKKKTAITTDAAWFRFLINAVLPVEKKKKKSIS